jgi:hypothetical protein
MRTGSSVRLGLAAIAPREVEFAWWLMQGEPEASFDDLLADIRDVVRDDLDERALALAFLGQMALDGYWYGRAVEFAEPERREAEILFEWHITRARSCMETIWSPI